jgi:hypothetical protein
VVNLFVALFTGLVFLFMSVRVLGTARGGTKLIFTSLVGNYTLAFWAVQRVGEVV